MKKIVTMLLAAFCGAQVIAQNIYPENDYVQRSHAPKEARACDTLATGWVIDANLSGGLLFQSLSTGSMTRNYLNAVNASASDIEFKNGGSVGIELQAGYFFGPARHFGIGAGIMYMHQMGDLTVDHFHVEYQSLDYFGNTFRQVLTSNGQIKESVDINSLSIPIVFKYKTNFTHHIGFTGDAGLLINVLEKNNYTANSSFDYEAIYKYSGSEGNVVTTYDNGSIPGSSDLLILKNTNPNASAHGNVQQYFNTLRANGYNVGLGVSPNNNKGSVSYSVPSLGFIVHPALNIWLTDNFSVSAGLMYVYQTFTNSASSNYMVTDKVGSYSSLMNNVTNSQNSTIGVDVGLRYSFTKHRVVVPPAPAPEPEADTTSVEEMPVASPVSEDEMEPAPVSISTPILFDVNKTKIKEEAYPVLEEAVKEMSASNKNLLIINGYTDNTGTASYNRGLSRRRALAVRNYLHKKGVKTRYMKTVGHGAKNPAASNASSEGRAMNRRVEMKLKDRKTED